MGCKTIRKLTPTILQPNGYKQLPVTSASVQSRYKTITDETLDMHSSNSKFIVCHLPCQNNNKSAFVKTQRT